MTKPILWLGPLEELDADYDPLLGRSAAQPREQTSTIGGKQHFDPSRSVFDDPIEPKTSDVEPLPIGADTREFVSPPNLEVEHDQPEPQALTVAVEPEPQATAPTVHHEAKQLEPTDFTHNNEPIPARQEPNPLTSEVEPLAPVAEMAEESFENLESGTPKKSFLTNLFAKRLTPIAAKPTPSFELEQEPLPDVEMLSQAFHKVDAQTAAESGVRTNMWDSISADADEAASGDAVLLSQDGNETAIEPNEVVPPIETTQELPTDIMLQPSAIEELDHSEADPEPEAELEAEAELEPKPEPEHVLVEHDSQLYEVEPAVEQAPKSVLESEIALTTDTVGDVGEPTTQDFKGAFNADKFWTLPSSHSDDITVPTAQTSDDSRVTELSQPEQSELNGDASAPIGERVELEAQGNSEELIGEKIVAAPAILATPQLAEAAPKIRTNPSGKRRKRKVKKNYVGAFFGTFLFGVALFMTLVSSLAAFGYPFDMISSYRWYWIILSVCAAGIWGLSRGWKMVAAAFAVMGINLFVTVPATGEAPKGGKTATAVIGWANVAGNADALTRVFKDAEKKKATLLMLAETPQSVFTPPAGWTLIEAPVAGDPTAIAVLSKSTWRAVTIPGEPTMARPPAGDLTVIGVHPQDASKGRRRTPNRDALINRAGTRAGIQEGPTIVIGDFSAAPWDKAMNQFRSYGNVTRVRCGGWAGTTLTQAFGLIGVATDHAYVRDVKVTHCQLGSPLSGGNHKPIWLFVAPQPAPPAPSLQP